MSKLSDSEVVERLARRLGWTIQNCGDWFTVMPPTKFTHYGVWDTGAEALEHMRHRNSDLLTSKDALAPVLAGLSDEEWRRLTRFIWDKCPAGIMSVKHQSFFIASRFVLEMSPHDLAHAIAEALGEPEVGKEAQ